MTRSKMIKISTATLAAFFALESAAFCKRAAGPSTWSNSFQSATTAFRAKRLEDAKTYFSKAASHCEQKNLIEKPLSMFAIAVVELEMNDIVRDKLEALKSRAPSITSDAYIDEYSVALQYTKRALYKDPHKPIF